MDIIELAEFFDSGRWFRGEELATDGKVSLQKEDWKNKDFTTGDLFAIVKGSGSNIYRTSVEIEDNQVVSAKCTCPDSYNFMGECKCKHVAAVLHEAYNEIFEETTAKLSTNNAGQFLLDKYINRFLNETKKTDKIQEKVTIEPILTIEDDPYNDENPLRVSFMIGTKKMYVLKDIKAFYDAKIKKEPITYGKDLTFIPNDDAFTEESIPFYNYICSKGEFLLEYKDKFESNVQERNIALNKYSVKSFMDLCINKEIQCNKITYDYESGYRWHGRTKEQTKTTLKVVKENPKIKMYIEPIYFENEIGSLSIKFDSEEIFFGVDMVCQITDKKLYVSNEDYFREIKNVLETFTQFTDETFTIGKDSFGIFYSQVLEPLSTYIEILEKDPDAIRDSIPEPPALTFFLDVDADNAITVKGEVFFQNEKRNIIDEKALESYDCALPITKTVKILSNYVEFINYHEEYYTLYNDEDTIFDFLTKAIPALKEIGELLASERFENINKIRKPTVSVGVSIKGNLLKLSLADLNFDKTELKDILASYKTKVKYHRLKDGSYLQLEDNSMQTLGEIAETLNLSTKDLQKDTITLPTYRALYIDTILHNSSGLDYSRDTHFKNLVKDFKGFEDSSYEVPQKLDGILRNYQKTGFNWLKLLKEYHMGGILADDMGLGKTLQVITLLSDTYSSGEKLPSLIVTPASLVYNWASEFAKFDTELSVCVIAGTKQEREKSLEQYKEYNIILTSYDLLKRDIEIYKDKDFSLQFIDEAQYIKTHTTQVAKAVKAINATQKYALTGTPIENRLSELWSIFDYLMPGYLYTYDNFKKNIESPIVNKQDSQMTEKLKNLVSPFILRRLKKDVLKDLPEKIEETALAVMEDKQQKLYTSYVQKVRDALDGKTDKDFNSSKIEILAELTRIRQICCDPSLLFENYTDSSAKLELCIEIIQNAIDSGHKILLFSQFTSMLEIIGSRLTENNIDFFEITGNTPKLKRLQLVDTFNSDTTPVFLISLKAGGTGLNLTGADIVIHYDPWWNIAAQNQATDRAHRIGQKNVVTEYKLITKGTIEEAIVRMQQDKKQLADSIISGEENKLSSMSKDDFMELLGAE